MPDDAIKAKIDTGARTSAIHAWDIERFERDGEPWVRFSLHPRQRDDDHVVSAEARLVEEREVRSSNGDVENRSVVETTLTLGDESWPIELTLTKRDQMGFRMLVGRTAMKGRLTVDPGVSYRAGGGKDRPPHPSEHSASGARTQGGERSEATEATRPSEQSASGARTQGDERSEATEATR